jgi:hypothetical protein
MSIKAIFASLKQELIPPPAGTKYKFAPQDDMAFFEVVAFLKTLDVKVGAGTYRSFPAELRRHFKLMGS